MIKVLLTSTSFQDTPGKHQELLEAQGYSVDTLRGPIKESVLLPIIGDYDAVICGDDEYTREVIETGIKGKLRFISKYGVGLDKIDLVAAKELGVAVTNCPGVNQTSVAEHVLALILTYEKNVHLQHQTTSEGKWTRLIGIEVFGRTIGIIGLGAIGKELAKKSDALGLTVLAFDIHKDEDFLKAYPHVKFVDSLDEIYQAADYISLHLPHNKHTKNMISEEVISNKLAKSPIIVNTARGKLVDSNAIVQGLRNKNIRGYLADVLESEPMLADEILRGEPGVIITPHVGSRTYQSVERQGSMAVNNLINLLKEAQ